MPSLAAAQARRNAPDFELTAGGSFGQMLPWLANAVDALSGDHARPDFGPCVVVSGTSQPPSQIPNP